MARLTAWFGGKGKEERACGLGDRSRLARRLGNKSRLAAACGIGDDRIIWRLDGCRR